MGNTRTYGRGANQKPANQAPAAQPQSQWGQPAPQAPVAQGQNQGQWGAQQPQQNPDKGFRGLSRGFAKFEFIANIAKDPKECEIRQYTDGAGKVHNYITIPVVVSRGNSEPSVFLITFWDGLGKIVWEHKVKGQALFISGEMNTRQSEQTGQYFTNFNADSCEFLN